jgi:hypothetical protein
VSPVQEIALVTTRELRKNLRSWKGIALLALSLLAGAGLAIQRVYAEAGLKKAVGDVPPEAVVEGFKKLLGDYYSEPATIESISTSSPFEWSTQLAVVIIIPLLVTLIGFDGVSTDLRHRTFRFWSVRCRRSSLFLGRFFGLWVTLAAMTLVTSVVVWCVLIFGGVFSASHVIKWGIRFWTMQVAIIGAWSALAVFLGSLFRSAFMSLAAIFGTFGLLYLVKLIGVIASTAEGGSSWSILRYVSPNALDEFILSPTPSRIAIGLAGCLAFILIGIEPGTVIFTKRDV